MPVKTRIAKAKPRANDSSTREHLLTAARTLFARKGLSGTSIRDIAQAARLNSSLISYYFESKEGLYRACIEQIAQSVVQMTQLHMQPAGSLTEYRLRLQMYLDQIFALLLEDRDTGLILIREYDRVHSPAEDIFRSSLVKVIQLLTAYFKAAQDANYLDSAKEPAILASLLFGCVTSQMRMDHLLEKTFKKTLLDNDERRRVENHIVDLFTIAPKLGRGRTQT